MRHVKWRIRVLASATLILGSISYSMTLRPGTAQAQAGSCSGPSGHYYAATESNTGNFYGTGARTTIWSKWSLNGHTNSFSNTAVWVEYASNINDSVEAGLETGTLLGYGYNGAMFAYYTFNDGQNSVEGPAEPTNTSIWEQANSNGTTVWPNINNWPGYGLTYGVTYPHLSHAQAETYLYSDIWMAGGSGQTLNLYYQDGNNGHWYLWAGWRRASILHMARPTTASTCLPLTGTDGGRSKHRDGRTPHSAAPGSRPVPIRLPAPRGGYVLVHDHHCLLRYKHPCPTAARAPAQVRDHTRNAHEPSELARL
jgi:hypothetical protein